MYDARFAEPDITVLELANIAGKARQLINRGLGCIAIVAGEDSEKLVNR